jgi:uncharacterized RDD family membrane protein YckC
MNAMTTSPNAVTASLAVLKRRVTATVIDLVLMTVLGLVVRSVAGSDTMAVGMVGLIGVAVYGIVQGETGSTPGKAFTGLKLVNERGRPPGAARALIRLAAWAVDGLPCFGAFGLLLIWFSPTHQRVGDTITRCFVISSREEPEEDVQLAEAPGPAPERYSSGDEERQDFDPIWDAKVHAYVQWDPAEKRWMKYDDFGGDWVPVDPD